MEYITAKEAAQRWEISVRLIQQYCTDGRIPGARKFSGAWAIPADAQKPVDPRKTAARTASESAIPTPSPMPPPSAQPQTMMPLMNTPFQPATAWSRSNPCRTGRKSRSPWRNTTISAATPRGSQGGRAVPHLPGDAGAAFRLPDLRLRQPLHRPDSPGPLRTFRAEADLDCRGGRIAPAAGCGGLCGRRSRGAAPPAPARGAAAHRGLPAAAARGASGCSRCTSRPTIPICRASIKRASAWWKPRWPCRRRYIPSPPFTSIWWP